nr:hypothetical protein BaRGS_020998 [Batillaria attramentaria]
MQAVNSAFCILAVGLPVARKHPAEFRGMWSELASMFEDFLFTKHPSPPTLSMEDFQRDEAIDCKMVHLIREDILPYASSVPSDFVVRIMDLLNRDTDSSRKLREDFARTCFETLLQFSFVSKKGEEGPRLAEITAVLKAITTLLQSLKKAPPNNVETGVWQQAIQLYPALVDCTTSASPQVTRALKDALHEYRDLLAAPSAHVQNGR